MKHRSILVVLDGFGVSAATAGNAIRLAGTPQLDALFSQCPNATLNTSGLSVGLPEGQMGNSEVGHLNLGAGRIVHQDLTRIDLAIAQKSFFSNPVLLGLLQDLKAHGKPLHLMGLVSDGGVHSHISHLWALLELARAQGVPQTFVHAFLDGRDTPPRSAGPHLAALEEHFQKNSYGALATLAGRFFAMDRDTRWDRVEKAHRAMVNGAGFKGGTAMQLLKAAYARGEGDEFVQPSVVCGVDGGPVGAMDFSDGVIFFNFRADRARELSRALAVKDFNSFPRAGFFLPQRYVTLTQYDETFPFPVVFPPDRPRHVFPELISQLGGRQLRIAETEKYAHVTYFFSGGREELYAGEERILVPSPREVVSYDLKPEMSAPAVTRRVCAALDAAAQDFVLVNFANADMVGHTGNLPAAIQAVRVLDECVGRIVTAARKTGYKLLLTADHGNIEMMIDPLSGGPHTAHTLNPVPVVVLDEERQGAALQNGSLSDVAPTLLSMLELPQPAEMTGRSLFGT